MGDVIIVYSKETTLGPGQIAKEGEVVAVNAKEAQRQVQRGNAMYHADYVSRSGRQSRVLEAPEPVKVEAPEEDKPKAEKKGK